MNIQFRPQRPRPLASTNIGDFLPGEVKVVAAGHEEWAKRLVEGHNEFFETGLPPGIYDFEEEASAQSEARKNRKARTR